MARQVCDQDTDLTGAAPVLRRGVAKDRRIRVEDSGMRHGRKSRSALFDGCKRHVLRDLDTGLIPAVGSTAANAPEASVTAGIAAEMEAAGRVRHAPGRHHQKPNKTATRGPHGTIADRYPPARGENDPL